MGLLNITTTVPSDPSGEVRSSAGVGVSPGGTHDATSYSELTPFTHTLAWVPTPGQVPASITITADVDNDGVTITPLPTFTGGTISGSYTGLFPIESATTYKKPINPDTGEVDKFADMVLTTVTEESKIPTDREGFIEYDVNDTMTEEFSYTISIAWAVATPPATGTDTFTLNDLIYQNFWKHSDVLTE